jgi:hypothetical protein
LFPAFHSGEDAAGICGGGFQIVDRSEDAALEASTRERGEEALDGVEPGS